MQFKNSVNFLFFIFSLLDFFFRHLQASKTLFGHSKFFPDILTSMLAFFDVLVYFTDSCKLPWHFPVIFRLLEFFAGIIAFFWDSFNYHKNLAVIFRLKKIVSWYLSAFKRFFLPFSDIRNFFPGIFKLLDFLSGIFPLFKFYGSFKLPKKLVDVQEFYLKNFHHTNKIFGNFQIFLLYIQNS